MCVAAKFDEWNNLDKKRKSPQQVNQEGFGMIEIVRKRKGSVK
jgi:hypothetical protein